MSCAACSVVGQLDPGQVPASCEQCGKTELDINNLEAWELYQEFPGLIAPGPRGWEVNYNAAFKIMTLSYIPDYEQLSMLRKLEAIRTGFAMACKRSSRRG